MIPAAFAYERPETVDDVVGLLAQHGSAARVLAGGQSLLPQLKARAITPKLVIDISRVTDFPGVECERGRVTMGAMTTQAGVLDHERLRALFPMLDGEAFQLGDPLIRNCGTFVGALAHGDPRSDWTAIAIALDVEVHVRGADGARAIPIESFLQAASENASGGSELVTHVTIPVREAAPAMTYLKLPHPSSGYALVGVAVAVEGRPAGTCTRCRVAVTGAARRPFRAQSVEDAICGTSLHHRAVADAAELAADGVELVGDRTAGPEYRALLVRTLVKRALMSATATLH